jgi:hypothetical protein
MTVPENAKHELGLLPPHWPNMAEVAQQLPRWDLRNERTPLAKMDQY